MTQLFLQLTQSVTGNVITIVALELAAAIIGFIIAWYYARSVYTPVIKGLEADKANLNAQVVRLNGELSSLNEKVNTLDGKIKRLEELLASKDKELKDLSAENVNVGKYVISQAKSGENYFNLIATNGQVILTSVMYPSMTDCTNGIIAARESCVDDNMFERKTSSNNKNFFSLNSPGGQIIGKSEMYESAASMEKGISSVKRNGISTKVVEE
jgi:uncharacterized protein YegP (UPF0339 family)